MPFLSTPSARRATEDVRVSRQRRGISIHALREEGDLVAAAQRFVDFISIHALREEGDQSPFAALRHLVISIHALREEGDNRNSRAVFILRRFLSTPSARRATPTAYSQRVLHNDFYPRPPRGGRPEMEP